jgi:hypothetical protein
MSEVGKRSAARFLERAAKCRQFAQDSPRGIASELERLATDYDQDAARLNAMDGDGAEATSL